MRDRAFRRVTNVLWAIAGPYQALFAGTASVKGPFTRRSSGFRLYDTLRQHSGMQRGTFVTDKDVQMTVSKLSPQPRMHELGPEVQRFGAVRLLPIALSAETRTESAQLLNRVLADTTILHALYKKHHWVVAGPTFYQLHLLFDKHAGEQLELVDLLAERIQSLGGIAVGDPRHAAELTWIPRPPDGAEEVPVMIGRLLEAHELIITVIRPLIEKTAKSGDWGNERSPDQRRSAASRSTGLVPVRTPSRHPPRRSLRVITETTASDWTLGGCRGYR